MHKLRVSLAWVATACAALYGCHAYRPLFPGTTPSTPAGVVLLVGDGMGDAEITAARNYLAGSRGQFRWERLPAIARVGTSSVVENAPHLPDYVVDSAASATAWSTGSKTSNGRISTEPQTDTILPTLAERCRDAGIPVGVVTTAEVTDATPAAMMAHVNLRVCQGPADMKLCPRFQRDRGGLGSIAEQILAQRFEVVLGGGRQRFEQPAQWEGELLSLWEIARRQGFATLERAEQLHARLDPPVLGLFAVGDFDRLWEGEPARPYPGSGPQRCSVRGRPAEQPSLETMARTALAILQREAANRQRPFFLLIEGANIDKAAHAADPCGQIGETEEFDRTVHTVLELAEQQGNILVIVTADHAHSTQIVPHPLAVGRSPGLLSTLVTREGALMTLQYATAAIGASQAHTGTDVPIYASGPGSEAIRGRIDQTELFRIMATALGLAPAAAQPHPNRPH